MFTSLGLPHQLGPASNVCLSHIEDTLEEPSSDGHRLSIVLMPMALNLGVVLSLARLLIPGTVPAIKVDGVEEVGGLLLTLRLPTPATVAEEKGHDASGVIAGSQVHGGCLILCLFQGACESGSPWPGPERRSQPEDEAHK